MIAALYPVEPDAKLCCTGCRRGLGRKKDKTSRLLRVMWFGIAADMQSTMHLHTEDARVSVGVLHQQA
jgi:predicted nucleic acid-binding Zn ribbon protein